MLFVERAHQSGKLALHDPELAYRSMRIGLRFLWLANLNHVSSRRDERVGCIPMVNLIIEKPKISLSLDTWSIGILLEIFLHTAHAEIVHIESLAPTIPAGTHFPIQGRPTQREYVGLILW